MIETYLLLLALGNVALFVIAAVLILRERKEGRIPEEAPHSRAFSSPAKKGERKSPAVAPSRPPVQLPVAEPARASPASAPSAVAAVAAPPAGPEAIRESRPAPKGTDDRELPWPMVPLTLVKAADPMRFWRIAVASGMDRSKMLVIAPESPAVVTGKYGLAGAKVWRVTRTEGEENVNPAELERIGYLIESHLELGAGRAVILSGIPRLIDATGFRNTRRLFDVAKEFAETNRGAILVYIDPATIEAAQLHQLEEGVSVIDLA